MNNKPIVEHIKKLICTHYKLTKEELVSGSRKKAIARPRQIAMYLARRHTDQSLQAIGSSFNRYHATVIHAVGAVEKLVHESGSARRQIEFISDKVVKLINAKRREENMSEIVFLAVERELMVRIDSLLSCLKHRHGCRMGDIGEFDEVKELATRVRKITEPRELESAALPPWPWPATSESECNCLHIYTFSENWDEKAGDWRGRYILRHHEEGFLRVIAPTGKKMAGAHDNNHMALGITHWITHYEVKPMFTKPFDWRDAKVFLRVRGNDFKPNGTNLVFSIQSQSNPELGHQQGWKRAVWGYTGYPLTDYLLDGKWHDVEFVLLADESKWTEGGTPDEEGGARYAYWELEKSLASVNVNFAFVLINVDIDNPPEGSIDFDELEIKKGNESETI